MERVRVTDTSNQRQISTVPMYGKVYDGTSTDIDTFTEKVGYNSSMLGSYMTKEMHDVVTPDYERRIAAGEIINNPMSITSLHFDPPTFTNFHRERVYRDASDKLWGDTWQCTHHVGDVPGIHSFLAFSEDEEWGSIIEGLKDQAVTQAYANASSAELMSLATLAEGRKSVASITSIINRLLRIISRAKKADYKYLRKQISIRELEDRYMELRYALRPLLYDVRGAAGALDESSKYSSTRATARGFAQHNHTLTDEEVITDASYSYKRTRISNCSSIIRAGVLTDVTTDFNSVWGLDQFAETAWELLPFSFICDWILNVGDTIAAWTPSRGVRPLTSWVTVEHASTYSVIAGDFKNTDTKYDVRNIFSWSGINRMTGYTKIREVSPPRSILPTCKVRLNTFKLLDLVIIGKRLLKGRLR